MGAPSEESSQSWANVSGTSSPFKEVLNEGGEESMMSTPNMSFDSPIIVTKSNFGGVGKPTKDSTESSLKQAGDSSGADAIGADEKSVKVEEEKKTKSRKDMFAPEADMFAEEYSVSLLYLFLFVGLFFATRVLLSLPITMPVESLRYYVYFTTWFLY